ncbi:uncharacterized protein LOC106669670 isoform X2 [Cimex lectularius]|uniref:Ionotropic receptor n=1 Tax=Cimex lectularius TaxID=79782 RepID=A0A8I6S0I4_CIMLE|nr:uncharacterized protein LOC106669670 isoform X2 [Cimex lectularius]
MDVTGSCFFMITAMSLMIVKGQIIPHMEEPVSVALDQLVYEVTSQYMDGVNCLVWVTNRGSPYEWNPSMFSPHVIVASADSVQEILKYSFDYNCQGYIVQTSSPEEFLNKWELTQSNHLRRHNPKMLFLPWDDRAYSDVLFNSEVANFLSDLLAIQVLENGPTPDDIIFEIVTNNFYEAIDTPDHEASIVLGVWPLNLTSNWFPDKISDLKGKTIKYATLQYPPYAQLTPEFDGMDVRLAQTFCEHYNCSLIPVSDDNLWGELWENKSGNGIVGNVYMGKADIGGGAVYLWYNEYKNLDFSYPYLESRVTVLVPKPRQLPEWSIPIIAFSPAMWGVQFASIAITAVLLFTVNKNAEKIAPGIEERRKGEFATFSGIVMRSFGMALLQPPGMRLISGSVLQRFFTLFEILFLLFTTIYSGALSSVLTVPVYYPPIDSPRALYKSGITWMADHDAWVYSLQQATQPYLQGLVKQFEAHETNNLIAYSKKGGYGFAIEIMAAGHVTHTAHLSGEMILGLHVMKKELYTSPSVTIFRKGTLRTKIFQYIIKRQKNGHRISVCREV